MLNFFPLFRISIFKSLKVLLRYFSNFYCYLYKKNKNYKDFLSQKLSIRKNLKITKNFIKITIKENVYHVLLRYETLCKYLLKIKNNVVGITDVSRFEIILRNQKFSFLMIKIKRVF